MIFFISFLSESEAIYLMSITILLLLFIMVNYYRINYNKLTKFATDTHYVHFKPSHKDLILSFYGQVFVVIILMVLILLFLSNWLINADSWNFLFLSFSIALILQCFTVFLINKAKIKLIDTANEPVDHSIISAMNKRTKDVLKIKNFAFADIKPASLFLSAGVTNYSFNSNICLISRYFQWKLSENELLSVIGHEIGHVVHRDLLQSQLLLDLQAITRVFLYYFLLINIQSFFGQKSLNFSLVLLQLITLILIIGVQLLVSSTLRLRMYNQEILADEYGASIMGNYNLAYTLKKLPNVIPAPVDDSPFQFLGFRTAILFTRAKQLNETDESVREFSRFSNN